MAELRRDPDGELIAEINRPKDPDELPEGAIQAPLNINRRAFLGSAALASMWASANRGESGLVQECRYEEATDSLVVKTSQDVEPLLDHNRELAVHGHPGKLSKDFRKIATIPLMFVHKWRAEGLDVLTCSHKDLMKKLDDTDFADFRSIGGRF